MERRSSRWTVPPRTRVWSGPVSSPLSLFLHILGDIILSLPPPPPIGGILTSDDASLTVLPTPSSLLYPDECGVMVDLPSTATTSCTPMRGYMTAWLPPGSEGDDAVRKAIAEAEILSFIEGGMTSDSYTSDDVVKVAYVGARVGRDDGGSSAQGGKDGGGDVGGIGSDAAVVGSAANAETTTTNGGGGGGGRPLVAGGIALFVLAVAIAVLLAAYNRRRRRTFSDGPGGDGDGLRGDPAPAPASVAARDPDDVRLLPSPDKLDMRSVHSADDYASTSDADTENYSHRGDDDDDDDDEWARRYGAMFAGGGRTTTDIRQSATEDYSNLADTDDAAGGGGGGGANDGVGRGGGTSGRSSDLAAMGMASTLAARTRVADGGLDGDDMSTAASSHVGTVNGYEDDTSSS